MATGPLSPAPLPPQASAAAVSSPAKWALPLALVALLAVAYLGALEWMVLRWPLEPYSGGGIMIPPIVAYLVWLKKERLAELPVRGSAWGLPILVLSACCYFVGSWTGINYPYAFSFLLMLWGMVLLLLGWAFARELAFPIAFLFFMLPLSSALDPFIFPLRLLATKMAAWLPIALGLETVVDGTDLHVEGYSMLIDLPCSGIRYVLAFMAAAALFAYFTSAALWRKLLIFCLGLPVALLTNVLRIDLTLLMGKLFGPGAARGLPHEIAGIVVFAVALICLFHIIRWLTPCSSGSGS